MAENSPGSDDIRAQTHALADMTRQLTRRKLGNGQTPAGRSAALAQKTARVELAAVQNSLAIAGTLTAIATQIGFQTCPLDASALRGALLTVMDSASDEAKVAAFRQCEEVYQASRRRRVQGVQGLVLVARPGAELVKAAAALGLRRDRLAGGLRGRADPAAFAALGRDYSCSVVVTSEGECVQLVVDGLVDEEALSLLGGQLAQVDAVQTSAGLEGEAAPPLAGDPLTKGADGTEGDGGLGPKGAHGHNRIASALRRPMGSPADSRSAPDHGDEDIGR
ncbi:hypothetical protein [uncultured Devosia sp.]|uniref:hypothetical protein n=1 Tax=uncultured Devosia sp. TaxID=211434 RepID=UPI00261A91BD|nr:hypothetical protein [uncultured Devosia sp.]